MTYTASYGPRSGASGAMSPDPFRIGAPGHARPIDTYPEEAGWSDGGPDAAYATGGGSALPALVQGGGALLSLALVVGVGIWGYGQVKRDVSGVPVVQALEGPMRVAPERPGGQISDHVGFAVNAVKAAGVAEDPAAELQLAPDTVDLADEDLPTPILSAPAEASPAPGEAAPAGPAAPPSAAPGLPVVEARLEVPGIVSPGQSHSAAIAEALMSAGLLSPLEDEGADDVSGEAALLASPDEGDLIEGEAAVDSAAATGRDGISSSIRPAPRPASRLAASPAALGVSAQEGDDTSPVEPGTRLVQLGAYESVEEARKAWGAIEVRFAQLMEDKARVVQEAETGGRSFWRLRASGFEDLADARRFCAALVADDADCIPVVAR